MSVLPILPRGFVVGRILTSRGDSADADKFPDTATSVGFVDFTPATDYRKLDATTVVTHSKITAKLDSHGDLHPLRETGDNTGSDTEDGIWLPTGRWKVAYRLNTGFGALPEHHIEVATVHTETGPLPLFANLGDPAPSGATLVQLTVPLGGQQGQVLVMNDGSLAWGAPSGGGGGYPVQQVTLTADLAYTLPVGAPTDQVIGVVFTQDVIGGHTVTYDDLPVAVKSLPGAETMVIYTPINSTWWPKVVDGVGSDGTGPVDPISVTPTGPTWTDDTTNGGGYWAATQSGVIYSPASGTATPSEQVTVTASPATGYSFPAGATTSWTHTFPSGAPAGTLASDSFNRGNGPIGNADIGGTWVAGGAGIWETYFNRARCASGASTATPGAIYLPITAADVEVSVVLAKTPTTSGDGVVARAAGTTSNTFYLARAKAAGSVELYRFNSGTATKLGSTPHTWVGGDRLTLRVAGGASAVSLEVLVAGVSLIAHSDVDAARLTTGTHAGMRVSGSGDVFDDFLVTVIS